jgi:hypothetical protein
MKTTKYTIRATYSYYSGTFNAPKNGNLKNQYGEPLLFDTREEAVKYLTAIPTLTPFGYSEAMGLEKNDDGSFSSAGTYRTAHGEYARPVYRVRKITVRAKHHVFTKEENGETIYSFNADFEDYWTQEDEDAIASGSTPAKF